MGMEADCTLDDDIFVEHSFVRMESPRNVLLTGATGFLGTYLLVDLLKLTQARIYCLIRSESPAHGRKRLLDNLSHYGLAITGDEGRVFVISGDMESERFGLNLERFMWLCESIDTIYHVAASTSFMPGYEQLRGVNVNGLREVLRLAARGRTKAVHYTSTYAVFNSDPYRSVPIVYERELEGGPEGLPRGYDKTKWVAERICGSAKERGIPVTVYRPGFITGDMENGIMNVMDPVALMFAVTLCTGYALRTDAYLHLTPVDYCSSALVRLSLSRESENRFFHLVQESPMTCSEYVDWLEDDGYRLQRVELDEWYEQLKAVCSRFPVFYPVLGLLGMAQNRSFGMNDNIASLLFDASATRTILPRVYHCPPTHDAILKKYFRYITSPVQPYTVVPRARGSREPLSMESPQ